MRIMRILGKLNFFLMTSFPVRMTSPQSDFQWKSRSWVDLSDKKIFDRIGPTSCLLNLWLDTLLFKFQALKKPTFQEKSTNQTSFSTKSTTLNPMVKSDLVTSSDGTIRFLFFSVANKVSIKFILLLLYRTDQIRAVPSPKFNLVKKW